jgi:hypothetical protein
VSCAGRRVRRLLLGSFCPKWAETRSGRVTRLKARRLDLCQHQLATFIPSPAHFPSTPPRKMDLSFFDGPCRRARGGLEITNRAELQHMEARSVSESLMRLLCKSVTAACPGVQNEHKRRRVGTPHPPSMCYFAGTADTGGACTGIAPTTTAVQMSPRSPSRRSSGSFEHPPYPFMLSPSASLRELDEPLSHRAGSIHRTVSLYQRASR